MDEDKTKSEEVKEEPKEEAPVVPPEDYSVGIPADLEPEEPKEEAPKEESKEESEDEVRPPSKRETLRVQQLLEKYGPPESKPPHAPSALDYSTALDADPEVIKQLEADRQAYGEQTYQQSVKVAETIGWKNLLKMESPLVEKEYKFLNPKDEENFKPAAANAMNTKYLKFVGYDPGDASKGIPETVQNSNISYREFIEAEMEFANEIASQQTAESVKNVVKQAAQTGLRPDGSSAKRMNLNKDPKDMTMDELYAASGLSDSRKK